jgi:hypothetical protein
MYWEIKKDKSGQPLLTRNFELRKGGYARGQWVPLGPVNQKGIEKHVKANIAQGYQVLPDEEGNYRILVLTD